MAVFLPSDTSTIRYEETDLASLHSRPSHFVCGVYLIWHPWHGCRVHRRTAICLGGAD